LAAYVVANAIRLYKYHHYWGKFEEIEHVKKWDNQKSSSTTQASLIKQDWRKYRKMSNYTLEEIRLPGFGCTHCKIIKK
jgi:hypothetical protein